MSKNLNPQTTENGDLPVIVKKDNESWFSKLGMLPISIGATVSMLASAGLYVNYSVKLDENRQKSTYLAELAQLAEKIEKNSLLVLTADAESFKGLDESQARVEAILGVLEKGGKLGSNTASIEALQGQSKTEFDKILKDWGQNKALIETLLKKKEALPALKEKVLQANKQADALFFASANLQQSFNRNLEGVSPILAQEVTVLTQRILNDMQQAFSGGGFSLQQGYAAVKNLRSLGKVINDLKDGSYVFDSAKVTGESLENLKALEAAFAPFQNLATDLLAQVTSLNDAKEVANIMSSASRNISLASQSLSKTVSSDLESANGLRNLAILMMLLTLVLVSLLFVKLRQRSNDLADLAKVLQKNQNNEEAVAILLNQMQPLAEGDLSGNITVQDKFLSKVAEGMEGARYNLASVIKEMKSASERVLQVAKNNKEVAGALSLEANSQIEQLGGAIEKVGSITNELDEVAQSTYGAKENSLLSKESSDRGGKLVFATIKHMDQIRNNIQESSKKIKKLGESAQTITSVIDLIREITKKINILSLNAAIQAASAKSSTREFTILAQEVQDLAKDSEEATSKIESLVAEIQADTAEAIAAMERTTQEIVEGAKMSQEAGKALEEIGLLAQEVAQQVEEASLKLEEKSAEMAMVSLSMEELRKVSEKTKETTAVSTERADELQTIAGAISTTVAKYRI